jgi:SAM-dependent methyltransferase
VTDQPITDYRDSHLDKGEDYDRELARGDFNTYMTDRERVILTRIVRELFPRGIPRYLDFACGTARITQIIEPFAHESIGVDVSPTMLEQARRKLPDVRFLERDLTRDRSGIAPVNLISSFRFFGDAQDELRRGALAAMHDLLVPSGYLVFNQHLNPWSVHNLLLRATHKPVHGDLTWPELRAMLAGSGFRVVQRHAIGFWLFREKWNRPEVLRSRAAKIVEPLFELSTLAPISPDAIIVAQRD